MIIGIDEVGRGAWAGPMVVGAVALPEGYHYLDSKQLSSAAREKFSHEINEIAVYCELGWVWPEEIDEMGLTKATTLAIERALNEEAKGAEIIIDGSVNFLADRANVKCIVKADTLYPAVAAASIVAKVARDKYMAEQASLFPEYGFEKHVGYGTKIHIDALKLHKPTKIHRMSYKSLAIYGTS